MNSLNIVNGYVICTWVFPALQLILKHLSSFFLRKSALKEYKRKISSFSLDLTLDYLTYLRLHTLCQSALFLNNYCHS